MTEDSSSRRLGTAGQAAKLAGVRTQTIRNWKIRGDVRAVRVGRGPFLYDLDDVAAMRVEYPRTRKDDVIAELVSAATEFSAEQINRLRLLLHAVPAPNGDDGNGT